MSKSQKIKRNALPNFMISFPSPPVPQSSAVAGYTQKPAIHTTTQLFPQKKEKKTRTGGKECKQEWEGKNSREKRKRKKHSTFSRSVSVILFSKKIYPFSSRRLARQNMTFCLRAFLKLHEHDEILSVGHIISLQKHKTRKQKKLIGVE